VYHVYLQHGTLVCWQMKTWLQSGPVTADLTTTVAHRYKLLINDIKPVHLLTLLVWIKYILWKYMSVYSCLSLYSPHIFEHIFKYCYCSQCIIDAGCNHSLWTQDGHSTQQELVYTYVIPPVPIQIYLISYEDVIQDLKHTRIQTHNLLYVALTTRDFKFIPIHYFLLSQTAAE